MRQVEFSGDPQWLNEHEASDPVENSGRIKENFLVTIDHGSTSVLFND
jgi:hypothetical protein